MDVPEQRGKRSRFDQAGSEPARVSRFNRRSRSPNLKSSDSVRDRSPFSRDHGSFLDEDSKRVDPATAAAIVAAKISEQLKARNGGREAESVPSSSHFAKLRATASASAASINGEVYISDGDFIRDIEINDLRNRYIVTNAANQKKIKDETGADVTTRGKYLPDKSMASITNPPLYLHITSTTKEGLESAIAKVNEMIRRELPPLVDERRFRRREREQDPIERDEFGRRKWPEYRIPINVESLPGFNLRAQVVGQGGAYVKHIQQETGCRVQIKGQGSGFIETSTGRESDEAMFLHVAGPDANMVDKAKLLCEDLLENVKDQYESFKSRPQRPCGYSGYSDRHNHHTGPPGYDANHGYNNSGSDRGSYNNYSSHSHQDYNSFTSINNTTSTSPSGSKSSLSPAPGTSSTTDPSEYTAQYAQYYGAADPYAPYGGYAAFAQYYQQYYTATQAAHIQPQQECSAAVDGSKSPHTTPPSEPLPSSASPTLLYEPPRISSPSDHTDTRIQSSR